MAFSLGSLSRLAGTNSASATGLLGQRNHDPFQSALDAHLEPLVGPEYLHEERIDLIIADPTHTRSYRADIETMRENADQVFLPVLVLTPDNGR